METSFCCRGKRSQIKFYLPTYLEIQPAAQLLNQPSVSIQPVPEFNPDPKWAKVWAKLEQAFGRTFGQAFGRTSNKMGSLFFLFFFGVASVTFHQRIAGSIIQDGRRLRSGRLAICIIYIIISLRKCMVYLWFILLRNGTVSKHYLSPRESVRSIYVFNIICVKSGIKLRS